MCVPADSPAYTNKVCPPFLNSMIAQPQRRRTPEELWMEFIYDGGIQSSNAFPDTTMVGSPPSASLFSYCPKKKVAGRAIVGEGGRDSKRKRMINNRESAARSRARKQAYTQELELEAARLGEENEKLKKQYQQLRLAMAAQLHSKKTLQRTSTAPF